MEIIPCNILLIIDYLIKISHSNIMRQIILVIYFARCKTVMHFNIVFITFICIYLKDIINSIINEQL